MIAERIEEINKNLEGSGARLVAVSKYHPASAIQEAYDKAGQRLFAESHALELRDKHEALPKDIEWHFIGHLQTNKIKYIAPFVSLIHSVDSLNLLKEIDKYAKKCERIIECLLEVHIAEEETKYGFSIDDIRELYAGGELKMLENVRIVGLMGMATATDDEEQVRREFHALGSFYAEAKSSFAPEFRELSMGMSGDYMIAIGEGSTLVRVGSYIFGNRVY